jgi:hypothetical protein
MSGLAWIEDVLHRRLAHRRISNLQPCSNLILVPYEIVEVQQVRRPMERGNNLDLLIRYAETE